MEVTAFIFIMLVKLLLVRLHPFGSEKHIFVSKLFYRNGSFVILDIGTAALELGLELEMILKKPSSPLPWDLWTPNLARWWFSMREPDPQSHVTLPYSGHVISKKRYISTFTRPMDPKISKVVNVTSTKSRDK